MRTIIAGILSASLLVLLAGPSNAEPKKKYRSYDESSAQYPSATPRQLRNMRAAERGGEYYEQDSNAHPVGSRKWWELKEREGSSGRF